MSDNMSQQLNEFYRKHESGLCSGDCDCSDCARDHFVILEEGEYIKDWIDPMEVVRCKDCVYWDRAMVNAKGFLICKASGMEVMAHDYCSYGEHK